MLAYLLWLITIAVTDLRIRKVRNWMVLLGLGLGAFALLTDTSPLQTPVWSGMAGMCAAFAALLPFYALRWMGAGDVKFAAVVGLWFGWSPALLAIWLGGSLLAGLHGAAVLLWRVVLAGPLAGWLVDHAPQPLARPMSSLFSQGLPVVSSHGKRCIPYAGYMALVAIGLLLAGDRLQVI